MEINSSQPRPVLTLAETLVPSVALRNWPLVDSGWRSFAIVLGTVAVGALGIWLSESVPMGLLAMAAVVVSMWRFWLPVHYRLQGRGIEQVCLGWRRLIPWRSVRQCRIQRRGVLILFERDDVLFGRFLASYVEWHDSREEVVDAIHFYCQTNVIVTAHSARLSASP